MPEPTRQPPAPTSAEEGAALARAAVAAARRGTLVAYGRHPSRQRSTAVEVSPRPDGSVEVLLSPRADAVRLLLARPLATVSVAPAGSPLVLLHGAAHRLPGAAADGRVVFHVEAGAVRLGEHCRPVDLRDYAAHSPAAAAVLQHQAPQVLDHLNAAHPDLLTGHLRAAGHPVDVAVATHLDARGLTLQGLGRLGVERVRLPFPTELRRAEHLPAALAAVLSCRCPCAD